MGADCSSCNCQKGEKGNEVQFSTVKIIINFL